MDALTTASSSGFVALFHRQFLDGVVAPVLQLPEFTTAEAMQTIQRHLEPHGLAFDALPGLLQRAVLWDTGLLFQGESSSNGGDSTTPLSLVQVWTQCGMSMAEIAIQPQEFAATQCAITTCSPPSRSTSVPTSSNCDVVRLRSASKCAVAGNGAPVLTNASVWSHESADDLEARVPTFLVYRHAAAESDRAAIVSGDSAFTTRQSQDEPSTLFSIRTARSAARSGDVQACPQSLVIPCLPLAEPSEMRTEQWCHPRSEPELSVWLSEFASSSRKPPTHFPSSLIYSALTESGINAGPAINTNEVFSALLAPAAANEDQIVMAADLARHYFRLHARGGSLSLKLDAHVPAEVLARLEPLQISFHDLSGLLQRALLWDTGYALTLDIHGKLQLVAIHVKCGLRMADIALNAAYYLSTGCDWDDCSVRNATNNITLYSLRSPRTCNIEQLEPVSLCAASDTSAVVSRDDSSIWALGNLSSASRDVVPGMRVSRRIVNASVLYTIGTSENEVQLGQCPLRPSLTIPCLPFDKVAHQSEWCRPIQSDLVTAWIVFEERQYMALINLIVLSGAVLIAVALDLFIDRKTRRVRDAAVGSASPSIDSADMDITEQSVQQSVVSGWSSTRSSGAE